MSGLELRVLIVDDEQPARRKVRRFLERDPDVTTILEAPDGLRAIDSMRAHSPDLVFLDVQMPGMDGFEVIESLAQEALPAIIFVTAFDEYALKAFDANAVDYLLKPWDPERFARAMDRARESFRAREARGRAALLTSLIRDIRRERPGTEPDRLLVSDGERSVFVRMDEIDWLESDRNYVSLYARERRFRLRALISDLEARLDARQFVRVSRSTIVRLDRIAELLPAGHGDMEIRLVSGARLRLSRRFRERLKGYRV